MSDERSDEQLIDAVLNGERSAFGLLFRRYQYRIAHAVMKYVHEQADVNDVVQESFIKAYRALPDFRGSSSFYSWIYRIAINCAKNFAVSHGSRAVNSFDVDAPETEIYDSSGKLMDADSPEALLSTRQLKRKVDDTLASMPEELRTALVLRQVEVKSYDEIAAAVGCPVGTVRSRIFRAREILVKAVSPFIEHV